ncbi:MAG: ABC transporter ATP-binding protein [Bifidobacterium sp.]|nr:ABC transporter ATP-binding protein [Bifidobacterium sp.]
MTNHDEAMITFADVTMHYGRKLPWRNSEQTVLDGVCLEVPYGQMLCLLGPSGAGKTTMVNLVMGNLVPDGGIVTVLGEHAPYPHVRRRIGYMPQDEALYEDITAEENLRFFGTLNGVHGKTLDERVDAMLELGRLTEHRKKLVSDYSGGMKRRLSLGVALLHDPDLLVLDEPTVGLDPDLRMQIWQQFHDLTGQGKTILVTTHVMDEAARCNRIAMLDHGHIIAVDSPEGILKRTGADNLEDAFLALEHDPDAFASKFADTDTTDQTKGETA